MGQSSIIKYGKYYLQNSKRLTEHCLSFFMVNGTRAGGHILFYMEYTDTPHITGPLETSPMWQMPELLPRFIPYPLAYICLAKMSICYFLLTGFT